MKDQIEKNERGFYLASVGTNLYMVDLTIHDCNQTIFWRPSIMDLFTFEYDLSESMVVEYSNIDQVTTYIKKYRSVKLH